MIRLALIIIIISILAGSIYWKLVPKPANLGDRINALENTIASLRGDVVNLEAQKTSPASVPQANYEARIKSLEDEVAKLKSQKAVISSNKAPLYIPLGSGGTAGDKGWYSVPGYEVAIDPADYFGYSAMQMEINFRMTEIAGVGVARLYNQTDNQAISGEITIASDNLALYSTPTFTLPSGKKTYKLQVKSTYGANLEIQSARIKVSF